MSYEYLSEAFKKLNLLQEQTYEPSLDGMKKLGDFMDVDDTSDITRVIDPEAEDQEELQTSYVGKVIIACNVCHSKIFENKEDIVVDEDGVVNSEMDCPYCGEASGFKILGKICPYEEEPELADEHAGGEPPVVEEPANEEPKAETPVEECLNEDVNKVVVEADDKCVTVDTHDEEVNVSIKDTEACDETEPCEPVEETIAPLTAEEQEEIVAPEVAEEAPVEEDDVDYDLDELDDESTQEVVENYLKEVYDNVKSFNLTDASLTDDHMLIEGMINFNSGKQTKTGFIFTPDRAENNKIRLRGMNEHFSKDPKAFSLVGCVEGKKFIAESLSYNYKLDEQLIKGRACRK